MTNSKSFKCMDKYYNKKSPLGKMPPPPKKNRNDNLTQKSRKNHMKGVKT